MGELMADKERQEALIKATDLDYVLVQPVALTEGPATGHWLADPEGRHPQAAGVAPPIWRNSS